MVRKYNFKINNIDLKNGENLKPNKINIIIGPNNSGKSKFLREISGFFYQNDEKNFIIKDIKFDLPKKYKEFYDSYNLKNKLFYCNNSIYLKTYFNGIEDFTYPNVQDENYFTKNILKSNDKNTFLREYGCLFLNYLGTENRLTMIKSQKCATQLFEHNNFLTELFNNSIYDEKFLLDELSRNVRNIFRKDIILDKETEPGRLFFRTGDDFDYYRESKRSDSTILNKFKDETLLDYEGDGLKSFVSTYLSLKYDEKNLILIDEPESFLHPPLARQLGEIIGESSSEEKQIFVTTHSSEILKGILSKCKDVNVIRITRNKNINQISILDNLTLNEIIEKPRLRVSKVLDGLFCEKVVITEAEADEIFYQEFLEKIKPQSGLFFTHVNSKNNIYFVSKMYRKLNVDNIMIFDFDIIRKKENFCNVLNLLGINDRDINNYIKIIGDVEEHIISLIPELTNAEDINQENKSLIKSKKDEYYHKKGLRGLPLELRKRTEDMLNVLFENNVFIVPNGELETNLEDADIPHTENKNEWITRAIEYIDSASVEQLKNLNMARYLENLN